MFLQCIHLCIKPWQTLKNNPKLDSKYRKKKLFYLKFFFFLQINRFINWLETGVKIATLVNFLVFLQSGWYLSLVERILGIRSVFPEKQGIRQVSPAFVSFQIEVI